MGWNGGIFTPGTICEDAPCCGCCGTNLYGQYQGEVDPDPDPFDYEEDWDELEEDEDGEDE